MIIMMACDSVECGRAREGMSCECKWYGKWEGVVGVGDGVCQVECVARDEGGCNCVDENGVRGSSGGVVVLLYAVRRVMMVMMCDGGCTKNEVVLGTFVENLLMQGSW